MKPKHTILLTLCLLCLLLLPAAAAADAVTYSGKTYTTYDQIYASTTLSSSEKLQLVQEMAGWTEELAAYMEWKNSGGLEAYQAAVSGGNTTNSTGTSSDYGWNEAPGDGLGEGGTNIEPEYSYQERQAYDAAYAAYQAEFAMNYAATAAYTGSGSGTQADPYIITTPAELQSINDDLSGHYKLGNDIDLSSVSWTPIGSSSAFTGSFNGDGFTISNLVLTSSNSNVGLFSHVSGNARLYNVKISNFDITAYRAVGALCGWVEGASSNLIEIYNILVLDSSSSSTISGSSGSGDIGAMVGALEYANIDNCYGLNVIVDASKSRNAGVLFGGAYSSNCDNCYAVEATVHGGGAGVSSVEYDGSGILTGYAGVSMHINNVYASGSVTSPYGSRVVGIRTTAPPNPFPILTGIYSDPNSKVNGNTISSGTTTNKQGQNIASSSLTQSFFEDTLGFDFVDTWYWDASATWQDATGTTYTGLPHLQVFRSAVPPTISAVSVSPSVGGQETTYTLSTSATTTGQGGISAYQWYAKIGSSGSWQAINGATSATYTFVPGSYAVGDFWFKVVVTGADGGSADSYDAGFTNVKATIVLAPQITSPTATPAEGPLTQTVQLSASVTSTETVTYQWEEQISGTWTAISGATSATTTVSVSDSAATTHSYRLVASNVGGSSTSSTVTYTSVAVPTISAVSASPSSGPLSQSVTLSATVSGATSLQWEEQISGTWTAISGATSATSTITVSDSAATTHSYRLIASNVGGSSTSSTVTYTSVAVPTISSVSASPSSGPLSQSVTLSATVSGATSLQWQEQIGGTWTAISGATSATSTVTVSDSAATTHSYRLIASNIGGSSTSSTVTYTSVAVPTISSVSASPTSGPLSQSVTLSATVSGATSLQWQEQIGGTWTAISGATSATSTVSVSDSAATTHSYRLIASNIGGSSTSSTVTYTSVAVPTISAVSASPSSGPLSETIQLSATVTGATSCQWQELIGGNWQNIQGATSATHTQTINDQQPTLHTYRLIASNVGGTTTSDETTYQSSRGPLITAVSASPSSGPLTQTVTLSASVTSTEAATYQWQERLSGNWQDISGATSATTTVSISDSVQTVHTYRVLATDVGGTTPSATVTYSSIAPPVIQGANINPVVGKYTETITLSAEVSGADTYQWQQQSGSTWENVSGATTNPWVGTVTVSGDTNYRLMATNGGGSTYSNTIQYTIAGPANIQSLTATPSVVAIPGSTTLQISSTNLVEVEWQQQSGGTWTTVGTGKSLTLSVNSAGTLTYRAVVEGADGTTTTSENLVVLAGYAPTVSITTPANGQEFDSGATITAQATITGTDVSFEWDFGQTSVGDSAANPADVTYYSQGYKTITLTAESIFGTATDSVTILYGKAPRPMQTELFDTVDTTPVDNLIAQFDVTPGEMPNPVGIIDSLFQPFDDALKGFFWVLVFGAIMLVVWLITKSVALPSVLGILFGSFMVGFMPDMYIYPAAALIAAGCAGGLLYVIRKN